MPTRAWAWHPVSSNEQESRIASRVQLMTDSTHPTFLFVENRLEWKSLSDPMEAGETVTRESQILKAVDDLDGERTSFLVLGESAPVEDSGYLFGGQGMCVAGGTREVYICQWIDSTTGDERRLIGTPDTADSELVAVKRGQTEHFRPVEVCSKDVVIEALLTFYRSGSLHVGFEWR